MADATKGPSNKLAWLIAGIALTSLWGTLMTGVALQKDRDSVRIEQNSAKIEMLAAERFEIKMQVAKLGKDVEFLVTTAKERDAKMDKLVDAVNKLMAESRR